MSDIIEALNIVFQDNPYKIVISKPITKNETHKKITVEKKKTIFRFLLSPKSKCSIVM